MARRPIVRSPAPRKKLIRFASDPVPMPEPPQTRSHLYPRMRATPSRWSFQYMDSEEEYETGSEEEEEEEYYECEDEEEEEEQQQQEADPARWIIQKAEAEFMMDWDDRHRGELCAKCYGRIRPISEIPTVSTRLRWRRGCTRSIPTEPIILKSRVKSRPGVTRSVPTDRIILKKSNAGCSRSEVSIDLDDVEEISAEEFVSKGGVVSKEGVVALE